MCADDGACSLLLIGGSYRTVRVSFSGIALFRHPVPSRRRDDEADPRRLSVPHLTLWHLCPPNFMDVYVVVIRPRSTHESRSSISYIPPAQRAGPNDYQVMQ